MAKKLPTLEEYLASDDWEEFADRLDKATLDELKLHLIEVDKWESQIEDEDSPDFDDVIMYEADLIDLISLRESM